MRKRTKVIISAGLAAFFVALFWINLRTTEKEPEYQGKMLSQWLGIWGTNVDFFKKDAKRVEAIKTAEVAVRAIGTNGIPLAIKWLSYKPGNVHGKLLRFVVSAPVAESQKRLIFSTAREGNKKASLAVNFFTILGPEATPAIPELSRQMRTSNDAEISHRAMDALAQIGTNSLPELEKAMAETNCVAREELFFIVMLTHFQKRIDWSPILPLMFKYADDPDVKIATGAIYALGMMKLEPAECLALFTNKLASPDPHIRQASVSALRDFGPLAASAVPSVLSALNDPNDGVRQYATNALHAMIRTNSVVK